MAVTLNLSKPEAWDALAAAWRVASVAADAAVDAHSRAEAEALARSAGAPGDASTDEEMRARYEHNESAAALCGVPEAEERQNVALELVGDLVDAALYAPAPTLSALLLKLDMLADPMGWNDLDDESWPILHADLRRFLGAAAGQCAA